MSQPVLYATEGDYGIKTLAEPTYASVDIVFVHDLIGNRVTTWTGNRVTTWTDKKTKCFWPEQLLPTDLPTARIITYGYDADIVRVLDTASANNLRDHGKSLAGDLARRRLRTKSADRPLIFVCHGLGGLVAEQALLISRGSTEPHVASLRTSTVAIAFLGTPHGGSDLANWAGILTGVSNLPPKSPNEEIIRVLEPASEMLANLQQEFHLMLVSHAKAGFKPIDLYCFYEELEMPGIGKIVPQHSAVLSSYPSQSILADHQGMTKFSSAHSAGYQAVSGQLWLWVSSLESEPTPSAEEIRAARERRLGNSVAFSETNASGGGTIVQANQGAGKGRVSVSF